MRRVFISFVALIICACAAPDSPNVTKNQPHLPPPGFPVSEVPVGQSCGGMVAGANSACGEGEYCHRDMSAQCGAADAPGVCRPLPEICTMEYDPVCGCDGKTYGNECAANGEGVSAAYAGECTS